MWGTRPRVSIFGATGRRRHIFLGRPLAATTLVAQASSLCWGAVRTRYSVPEFQVLLIKFGYSATFLNQERQNPVQFPKTL
jgi:hypothetical protein